MDRDVFNGIDFTTCDYLTPPTSASELARWVRAQRRDRKQERDLQWAHERDFRNRGPDRRPAPDVDPLDLASSGWGVIIPEGTPRKVREALAPLLELRREQATRKKDYYRTLKYVPGESKDSFFRRYPVDAGPAKPEQLPYYLLIVGPPEIVPHRFQYQIDVQYAVGRLAFDDPDHYRIYAESVVAAEEGQCHVLPEACFFSVVNPGDSVTETTTQQLVQPLVKALEEERPEWKLRFVTGEQADKTTLLRLLGYGETPALLLTAAHGLAFPAGHPLQREQQGAIVCRPWLGRHKSLHSNHFLTANDIGDDARVHGLVAFLFGCNTVGAPAADNYPPGRWGQPRKAPEKPFISGLARRLLSHPNGSALAVVGHVDRAWTSSFGSRGGEGILYVESFFKHLLDGFPVGLAMDWIHERFAELSTELTDALDKYKDHEYTDPAAKSSDPLAKHHRMARLWRAHNDARNLVVLGDPAVRLASGPQVARLEPVLEERRATRGGLTIPLRSHWGSYVKAWLEIVGKREAMDLGMDPAAAVRAFRDREEV